MDEEYVKQLENTIKQMLRPLKDIPLKLVIESLCGHTIIPFNPKDNRDMAVLNNLKKAAQIAGANINRDGILRKRPNEVGNDIEPFVKAALNKLGYTADVPSTKEGHKKAMGYPDIEFIDDTGKAHYLECKTFNIENITTTQRSFYLSPSEDFKVTQDAHHFILSFEIVTSGRQRGTTRFKCKSWKILSAEKLLVDVKYEFNSDNARMYGKGLILAEGELPGW